MSSYIRDNKNNSIIIYIGLLCYSIYILLPMASPLIPQIIRYGVLLSFLALSVLYTIKETYIDKLALPVLITILLYTVTFYYSNTGKIGDNIVSFFMTSFLFWIPLLVCFSINELSITEKEKLTKICVIIILISVITTIIGNIHYPLVSRYMAGKWSTELVNYYQRKNIGGYEFVYALVILMPYWVYLIREKRLSTIAKIMIVGTILVAFVTQYTLAWIICLIELLFLLFLSKKNILLRILILIFVLYILINTEYIGGLLYKLQDYFYDNDMVTISERIGSIGDFFTGKRIEGDFIEREALYLRSLEAFYRSPIIGSLGDYTKLGGHSTILDTLGALGIFGFSMLFIIITYYLYKIRTLFQTNLGIYIIISFVSFFIISVFNTGINGYTGFALFITPFAVYNEEKNTTAQIREHSEERIYAQSYIRKRSVKQ